jgi:3-oxoacyl-[acyl-carrier-protein] synthase-3
MTAFITSVGAALPERIVTNAELGPILGVSPDWIETNSGIKQRRWAGAEISASDLAAMAVADTTRASGESPNRIDYLIGCTMSPDYQVPGIAPLVQSKVPGIGPVPALDIRTACCGLLYSLQLARGLVNSGAAQWVVCFGTEAHSKGLCLDRANAEISMLFGDGAGALLVQPQPATAGVSLRIDDVTVFTDGAFARDLVVRAPGSGNGAAWLGAEQLEAGMHLPRMEGKSVILHAVRKLYEAAAGILTRNGLSVNDIDVVIPHQANGNLLKLLAKRMEIAPDRIVVNLDRFGNTGSASAFIALWEAKTEGRLKPGARVLFLAFGAGFTWGAALATVVA